MESSTIQSDREKGIGVGGIKGNKNQVPLYVLDINKQNSGSSS